MDFGYLFFSWDGRIGRGNYWLGTICLGVVGVLAGLLLWTIFGPGLILSAAGRFTQFVVSMALLYPGYCLMAKRFQDRNESRSLAQIGIGAMIVKAVLDLLHVTGDPWVPTMLDTLFLVIQAAIGIWYFIALGCLRGTIGANAYGSDPVGDQHADASLHRPPSTP
jgi:uncharacterized membrane protein YhaH (DUF805 family)